MKVKIDPLDKLFSEYIRKRAVMLCGGCQRCGSQKGRWKELQTCHFHGRRKQSVRWDEDNAIGGCGGCHMYLDSHPMQKVEWWRDHIGEDAFNALDIRARTVQKVDKELTKLYIKELLKEIDA